MTQDSGPTLKAIASIPEAILGDGWPRRELVIERGPCMYTVTLSVRENGVTTKFIDVDKHVASALIDAIGWYEGP